MCSGYVVRTGRDTIVFDHGFGAHHRLLELGISATEVTHAFFSHHHYDHVGDYPRLLLTRWDQGAGRVPELCVYGPPGLELITQRLIADDGAFGLDLISRTRNQASIDVYRARGGQGERARPQPVVRELRAGEVIRNEAWSVEVAEVNHFAPHLTSYGYRLEAEGKSFVYSGDTGPCRALASLARNCDVLVHMCHYLTGTAPSTIFAAFTMGHIEVAQLGRTDFVEIGGVLATARRAAGGGVIGRRAHAGHGPDVTYGRGREHGLRTGRHRHAPGDHGRCRWRGRQRGPRRLSRLTRLRQRGFRESHRQCARRQRGCQDQRRRDHSRRARAAAAQA
jgi:ribonuclease BN (tRNA processing enzyme)